MFISKIVPDKAGPSPGSFRRHDMQLPGVLLGHRNSPASGQLAENSGLSEASARQAVAQMAPALTCGMPHNIRDPQGFEALTQALARGNHRRHVEQPEIPGDEDTVADGNAIPGHLFGGKALSREVAGCILR